MSLNTVIAFAVLLKKVTRKKNVRTARKSSYTSSYSSNSEVEEERRLENACSIQPSLKVILQSSLEDIISHPMKEDLDVANMTNESNQVSAGSVIIRDFAYPKDSPLHFGNPLPNNQSMISLSSPDFNGRDARALFDFIPETEYEIGFKAGQLIWVQYRECPGWLIADVQDQTGLVPESYVEFI
ncbi:hypothetical protein G6F62_010781 [Rhizopus arrhizus]|nr:hypothetical protein G6F62_010781 [Rhizopus arrhizus]KAG1376122.1 hypothetical protein G6F61_007868 [Rhizopus arrhizus]